jgi:ferredoxin
MHEGTIVPVSVVGEETVEVSEGRRLVLGLEDAGIDILHRCGGNARCATCRVEILEGEPTPVTPWEETRLSLVSGRQPTTRLACQIQVKNPLTVSIVNRLSGHPELGDAGPRPIEWPAARALEPES